MERLHGGRHCSDIIGGSFMGKCERGSRSAAAGDMDRSRHALDESRRSGTGYPATGHITRIPAKSPIVASPRLSVAGKNRIIAPIGEVSALSPDHLQRVGLPCKSSSFHFPDVAK